MVVPLYKNHNAPKNHNNTFNTGLWYDKFCHVWPGGDSWSLKATGEKNPKSQWINSVTKQKIGHQGKIKEYVHRVMDLTFHLKGQIAFYKTEGRFVTGLGREHPVENGFAWHFTLGTPYLPGSSVKGLVRAWASNFADSGDEKTINRIFGPEPEQNEKTVGSVIFLDALPISTVQLEADVMTPHYTKYYQGEESPGDWLSPGPIPFLTVAPGEKFIFAILPRNIIDENNAADVTKVTDWLTEALAWLGAGAKTATGYGRFILDQETTRHWINQREQLRKKEQLAREEKQREEERKRALAAMSSIRREMENDGYSQKQDPNLFLNSMNQKWLGLMETEDTPPADRQEIAQLLLDWYQKFYTAQWKKPNKKNKEKINRIKAVLKN